MACPWKFLFKARSNQYDLTEETDLNNNVWKTIQAPSSTVTQDDPKGHSLGRHRNESPQPLTGMVKKSPESQVNLDVPPSACPRHVRIKNWGNGMTFQDTLHREAKGDVACKSRSCLGAIMNPKSMTRGPRDKPTPPDELLPHAIEFVNQYYGSFKEAKIEEHLARLEAVTKEIETTGTYQLTRDELIFATKQAWRNAPRCIGRIQWSNLQVFDARSCSTAQEMFEHICRHLRYSTNNGNIRSAITVFPQRSDGKHDFRVWNAQLIRYAGYQMPDGTIRGDPASVEFTQLCIDLGWKPKYGRFDVMPLVLQADGRDPELFEIPPDLVLEVPMEHPKYEWFRELELKWYALPAVANMLLEVGGLEFPGCPFNGWYMGTEIGVRDYCDMQRYDILEEVGRRMGLETHKLASLWKDRAVIEINVAVLHSFQKQNVTIMDHHSAAESFMKHMQNEYRSRGGCPADWVWLVPPISGSITPVFHQEMLNYVLSPFYYYQVEAWKTHVWQDEKQRPRRREIRFKVLVKAVLFASMLMRKTMASRVRATILFATETGKSETLARDLEALFSCAFNPKVLCMDEYLLSNLEEEQLLLVVTSTFGNGDSPGNGEKLKKSLFILKKLTNKFRYAVFGLGSSMYPQFCAFAHDIDQKLSHLGASQLAPTGEGDELGGQEEAFRTWAVQTFKAACETFDVRGKQHIQIPKLYTSNVTWDPHHYRLIQDSQPLDLSKALSSMHAKNVFTMRLKSRQNLQSPKSSRTTLLVELSIEASRGLSYLPGEHLGVFPGNQPALVQGILERVVDGPAPHEPVRLETLDESGSYWVKDKRLPPCSLRQALTYFLDITTPPTQMLLRKLAQLAMKEAERQRLETLCQPSEYSKWKFTNSPTFLEVLEEFPSLRVSAGFLLSQLPILKPRYYSISSSQDHTPTEVHLTVAVLTYRTRDGQGPLHHGVCSTWLSSLKPQDPVPCFVRSASGFQLPEDPSHPCILIGPGTGIAPFRSFWQQRLHDIEHKGLQGGRMTLVFGCRHPDEDHLYREEMLEMAQKGVLHQVHTAYSRLPGQPKVYVQDILRQQLAGEVLRVLHEEHGHLYVCGDVRMARDVAHTLKQLVAAKLSLSEEQVEDYFFQLKSQKRYHEDIFGAVVPYRLKKDGAAGHPSDPRAPSAHRNS
ncbi:nitric oxide synthase, inducible [Diceros bicornis minor]|uniref:nitric oxide synthase, inducible n=1 Tax=Diceros bicornis minor TaxID=77932 RepID=UPI0026E9F2BE|nr:nitric oxide synthase, inducible [Diceros bicornis minor]XP_058416281.1 nitric oxide synthase, inducible [Diceros bicornis minor]XP_058416282.1 nitric oxide synthase, inducible [Diceros bicornis minor]